MASWELFLGVCQVAEPGRPSATFLKISGAVKPIMTNDCCPCSILCICGGCSGKSRVARSKAIARDQ
eukprot:scaffold217538_cov25-Prasinocladus_malaysianus.AAC.1